MSFLNDFISKHGIKGVVITSPPYSIVDLCIPMLVNKLCHQPQVYHLGYQYLLNAPHPRHKFLEQLGKEGRLHMVTGLPRNKTGHRAIWLVVFPKQDTMRWKKLMLRNPSDGMATITFKVCDSTSSTQ
mgnify:CR=1 FL=1